MKKIIKEISKEMARMEPKPKGLMVSHPYFSICEYNGCNITTDEDAMKAALLDIDRKIDACKKSSELLGLITPGYKEKWLELCKPHFTQREFSILLGMTYIKNKELLRGADKSLLMNKEEYAVYESLPDRVTLYMNSNGCIRGKTKAEKLLGKDISKTVVKKTNILRYYNRWGHEEYIFDSKNS